MTASIYSRKQGPIYGSRPTTAKQLAEKLRSRCFRELMTDQPHAAKPPPLGHKIGEDYYQVSERILPMRSADVYGEGAYYFHIVHWKRVAHRTRDWSDNRIGLAQIMVTPDLEVVIENEMGREPTIEKAVLSCALRGPDR